MTKTSATREWIRSNVCTNDQKSEDENVSERESVCVRESEREKETLKIDKPKTFGRVLVRASIKAR